LTEPVGSQSLVQNHCNLPMVCTL